MKAWWSRNVFVFFPFLFGLIACSEQPVLVFSASGENDQEETECQTDGQCASGETCMGGTCHDTCHIAADCSDGYTCLSGICVKENEEVPDPDDDDDDDPWADDDDDDDNWTDDDDDDDNWTDDDDDDDDDSWSDDDDDDSWSDDDDNWTDDDDDDDCSLPCPSHSHADGYCTQCLCDEGYCVVDSACELCSFTGQCQSFLIGDTTTEEIQFCLQFCTPAYNTCGNWDANNGYGSQQMSCEPLLMDAMGDLGGYCIPSVQSLEEFETYMATLQPCDGSTGSGCHENDICLSYETGSWCFDQCPMQAGGCGEAPYWDGLMAPMGCYTIYQEDNGDSLGACRPWEQVGSYYWPECDDIGAACDPITGVQR